MTAHYLENCFDFERLNCATRCGDMEHQLCFDLPTQHSRMPSHENYPINDLHVGTLNSKLVGPHNITFQPL